MRLTILLIVFSWLNSSFGQNYYLDTLPKLNLKHGVSVDLNVVNSGVGISYGYNFWNGLGYRNYNSIESGLSFHNIFYNNTKRNVGIKLGIWHHHRLKLKSLAFFTIGLAYQPFISTKKKDKPTDDDFINYGYIAMGISGFVNRVHMGVFVGPTVGEAKQDLYYSIHTYAHFSVDLKCSLGFFFGRKK